MDVASLIDAGALSSTADGAVLVALLMQMRWLKSWLESIAGRLDKVETEAGKTNDRLTVLETWREIHYGQNES